MEDNWFITNEPLFWSFSLIAGLENEFNLPWLKSEFELNDEEDYWDD